MSVFVAVAAQTLLHLPLGKIPSLKNYLTELPVGMRLWGCTTKTYPIAMIYLNLMGAMDAMNLRKEDIAKKYFMDAWLMAKPDSLIEGIGEHHGLLQGLIETCIRNDYPEDYQKII